MPKLPKSATRLVAALCLSALAAGSVVATAAPAEAGSSVCIRIALTCW